MRKFIPHPSCDNIDDALEMYEYIVVECDAKVVVDHEPQTMMVRIHQRLRNQSYLVEGDGSIAYIVHYRDMSNLKYDY